MMTIKGSHTTADIMIDKIDDTTFKQISDMTNNSTFTNPIKIMPDCHAGTGSVIGFTMELGKKLNPELVGVDIGCGMLSVNIGKHTFTDDNLKTIDEVIRKIIPMGFNIHNPETNKFNFEKEFDFKEVTKLIKVYVDKFYTGFDYSKFKLMIKKYSESLSKRKDCRKLLTRIENSVGTLGGGNHFIEFGKDENSNVWITIHSGSRNLGQQICKYHTNIAKLHNLIDVEKSKEMYQKELELLKLNNNPKDYNDLISELKIKYNNLSKKESNKGNKEYYLENDELKNYLIDMIIGQEYAKLNRKIMMQKILDYFSFSKIQVIESIHNYINFQDNIIRKGAISAHKDEVVIIPFNMRDGLIIAKGKGNKNWNYSAPHGAGRILSRMQAKRELSLSEFKKQMDGIYSSSIVKSVLDEAPDVYKDSNVIKKNIKETVEILYNVKPILNIKSK